MRNAARSIVSCSLALHSCAGIGVAPPPAVSDETPRPLLIGWYDKVAAIDQLDSYAPLGMNAVVPYVMRKEAKDVAAYALEATRRKLASFAQIPFHLLTDREPSAVEAFVAGVIAEEKRLREREATDPGPLFYAWYLADEPELNKQAPQWIAKVRALIAARDPRPALLINYEPGAIAKYASAADFVGIDYYPAFKLTLPFLYWGESFRSRIHRAAQRAEAAAKGLFLVMQGYGPAPDGKDQFMRRFPTREEARYWLWAALGERPRGLFFWVRYRTDPKWVDTVLRPALKEFRDFFPGDVGFWTPTGCHCPARVTQSGLVGADGRRYLLFVNDGFSSADIVIDAARERSLEFAIGSGSTGPDGNVRFRLQPHDLVLLRVLG